ncbi:MAG: tripartite tricarboxylate transporter TctB family protein [Rhodospirillales bacterium]|nr:tripartite tricarboxylate transporter TctB family protein [Rhodospirillales bacterium]
MQFGSFGGRIRSPQDAAAGVFLVAVAVIALWQGAGLAAGHLNQLGPGMLPRALAVLVGICGLALAVGSFFTAGKGLERWTLRGPVLILGAAVAFGLAVRPLGLAVAGPITMFLGAFASPETRWQESLVFSLVVTAFCVLLFKFMLGLPIPLAPWLLGY